MPVFQGRSLFLTLKSRIAFTWRERLNYKMATIQILKHISYNQSNKTTQILNKFSMGVSEGSGSL